MTPLEDRVRRAIRDKAGEVPSDAVPPLRLPARRRRSFSLTYWGGGRTGAAGRRGWRGWLAPAAAAVLVVAVVVGSEALSRALYGAASTSEDPASCRGGPGRGGCVGRRSGQPVRRGVL